MLLKGHASNLELPVYPRLTYTILWWDRAVICLEAIWVSVYIPFGCSSNICQIEQLPAHYSLLSLPTQCWPPQKADTVLCLVTVQFWQLSWDFVGTIQRHMCLEGVQTGKEVETLGASMCELPWPLSWRRALGKASACFKIMSHSGT